MNYPRVEYKPTPEGDASMEMAAKNQLSQDTDRSTDPFPPLLNVKNGNSDDSTFEKERKNKMFAKERKNKMNKNDFDFEDLMKFMFEKERKNKMEETEPMNNASSELSEMEEKRKISEVEEEKKMPGENPDGRITITIKNKNDFDFEDFVKLMFELMEEINMNKNDFDFEDLMKFMNQNDIDFEDFVKFMSEKEKKKKIKKCAVKKKSAVLIVPLIIVVVIVGLVIRLSIVHQRQEKQGTATTPTTAPTAPTPANILRLADSISKNMDEKKKPCDDFWLHSCGGYIKSHPYVKSKEHRGEINVKAEIQQSTDKEVIRLLEETTTESTIEPVKMIKKLYSSCIGEVTTQNSTKRFLYELSEKLGGVPIITGDPYLRDHETVLRTLFRVTGDLPWIQYYILNEPEKNRIVIKLRLKVNCNERALSDTVSTVKFMFPSFIDFDTILKFCEETSQMVDLSTNEEMFNGEVYTECDITKHLPGFDLVNLFRDIVTISSGKVNSFSFIIDDMLMLKRFIHLVNKTDATDFMNIAFLEVFQDFYGLAPIIGKYFSNSNSSNGMTQKDLNSNLSSIPAAEKQTCLDIAYLASDVLGWMYFEKYFNMQVPEQVHDISKYLEKAMDKFLSESEWLDEYSQYSAKNRIQKLNKRIHVGSQHSNFTKDKLIKRYANITLSDKFFDDTIILKKRCSHLKILDMLENNGNIVSDMDIKAVYYVVNNSIHIPIAMLQPPIFYEGVPMAVNFGRLGTLIGHEILHAFQVDFANSYFNKGCLNDESRESYKELKEDVIKVYSGYKCENMTFTINGERTANENIADIGALKIAYEAYLQWKSDHPSAEETLPRLKMTDLQLFFTAYAQSWCSTVNPEEEHLSKQDVHSPMEARVQVPLKNSKEFADTFSCPKDSNMNPGSKFKMWKK